MSRTTIVFFLAVALAGIVNFGLTGLILFTIGTYTAYVAFIVTLRLIANFLTKDKKEKVSKIIDVVDIGKPVDYSFSKQAIRAERKVLESVGQDYFELAQNYRLFAKKIKAIPEHFDKDLPSHLSFVTYKKMLFELRKKHGDKYSTLTGKRSLTEEEILRPLETWEIEEFHNFCKENPLCRT